MHHFATLLHKDRSIHIQREHAQVLVPTYAYQINSTLLYEAIARENTSLAKYEIKRLKRRPRRPFRSACLDFLQCRRLHSGKRHGMMAGFPPSLLRTYVVRRARSKHIFSESTVNSDVKFPKCCTIFAKKYFFLSA